MFLYNVALSFFHHFSLHFFPMFDHAFFLNVNSRFLRNLLRPYFWIWAPSPILNNIYTFFSRPFLGYFAVKPMFSSVSALLHRANYRIISPSTPLEILMLRSVVCTKGFWSMLLYLIVSRIKRNSGSNLRLALLSGFCVFILTTN